MNIAPDKVTVNTPTMSATYVVKVVTVGDKWVTIEVAGKEYRLLEGETFNFSLDVS